MSKIYILATGLIAALSTAITMTLPAATDISFAEQRFKRIWLPVQIAGKEFKSRRAYIRFYQNFSFGGNAGCNNIRGRFSTNGNKIEFTNFSITLMGCIDPEVMKQEEMFVQLLTEVTKFTRNGNMLTLIDDEGTAKARLVELDSLLIRTSQAYPEAGPPETARVNRTICDPCHLGARMSSLHHLAESPRERSMNAV